MLPYAVWRLALTPSKIAEVLKRELAMHGHPLAPTVPPTPLDQDEVLLLTASYRLRGKVQSIRAGELMAEVTLEVPPAQVVAAITRTSLD